jgi:hypothetical protein
MNFPKQLSEEQIEDVLSAYWFMLLECQDKASDDVLLQMFISKYFKVWNDVTGQEHLPKWEKK